MSWLRKKPLWLAFLALLMGVGFFWLLQYRTGLGRYGSIKPGMTLDEVTRILGLPPGDYGPGKTHSLTFLRPSGVIPPQSKTEKWEAGELLVVVYFDSEDHVVDYAAFGRWSPELTPRRKTLVETFLEWWRKWR